MYLFIDTTNKITIGLLNDEFGWLKYEFIDSNKSSALIHGAINDFLQEYSLELTELTGAFFMAGPGSYTGMRVSEGIKDIFEWEKVPVYSFYHFEVPFLVGIERGLWLANAFKGEYFVYEWDGTQNHYNLIKESDFEVPSDNKKLFLDQSRDGFLGAQITSSIIYSQSAKLFAKIKAENKKEDLFYYRTIDEEFKRKE